MTILFFLLFAYASGCEDFWIPVRDSCYRTSPHAMNWNAAEQVSTGDRLPSRAFIRCETPAAFFEIACIITISSFPN